MFTHFIESKGREVEDREKKAAAKKAEQLPDSKSPDANTRGPEGKTMVRPPFKSEGSHHDPLGVSGVWTRPIKSSSIMNHRKNIQEKWAFTGDRATISKRMSSHEEASSGGRTQENGEYDGSEQDPSLHQTSEVTEEELCQSTQKELQESRDPTIERLRSEEGFLPTMMTGLRQARHEATLQEANRERYSK